MPLGYDHQAGKEAHVKDASHGDFKEDNEYADADQGLAHSIWDKVAHGKSGKGYGHNHGAWKQGVKEWDSSEQEDGWKGSTDEHLHNHHQREGSWD